MQTISTLFERPEGDAGGGLTEDLQRLYGGDLRFRQGEGRPYVIGNFVSTLDGVVSFAAPGKSGGGEISGFDEGDRFIMGLLRATADAVVIGVKTLHEAGRRHLWTAESVNPAGAVMYEQYRRERLKKERPPVTVIVSARGNIDLRRAAFETPNVPAVILTTEEGRECLEGAGVGTMASTTVRVMQASGGISPDAILNLLWQEFGVRLLLHEGGPTLFGAFVKAGLVDEYFVTISPQLAGR